MITLSTSPLMKSSRRSESNRYLNPLTVCMIIFSNALWFSLDVMPLTSLRSMYTTGTAFLTSSYS